MFRSYVLAGLMFSVVAVSGPVRTVWAVDDSELTDAAMTLEGTIVAIDVTTKPPQLTVEDVTGEPSTYAVDRVSTAIRSGGKTTKLDQLKVSQQVQVQYTLRGGRFVATSIDVMPAMPDATTVR